MGRGLARSLSRIGGGRACGAGAALGSARPRSGVVGAAHSAVDRRRSRTGWRAGGPHDEGDPGWERVALRPQPQLVALRTVGRRLPAGYSSGSKRLQV